MARRIKSLGTQDQDFHPVRALNGGIRFRAFLHLSGCAMINIETPTYYTAT